MSDTEIAPAGTASRQPKPHTGRSVRQHLLQHVDHQRKPKYRDRGVPPPPTFDFDALADGTHLTKIETAAVLRRSVACLQNWQKDPKHPLKWQYVAGRVIYTALAIRKYRKAVTK
jgi:hypothetical protein